MEPFKFVSGEKILSQVIPFHSILLGDLSARFVSDCRET